MFQVVRGSGSAQPERGYIFLGVILKFFYSFRSLAGAEDHHSRGERIERSGMTYFQFFHSYPAADMIADVSYYLKRSPAERFIEKQYFSFFKIHVIEL